MLGIQGRSRSNSNGAEQSFLPRFGDQGGPGTDTKHRHSRSRSAGELADLDFSTLEDIESPASPLPNRRRSRTYSNSSLPSAAALFRSVPSFDKLDQAGATARDEEPGRPSEEVSELFGNDSYGEDDEDEEEVRSFDFNDIEDQRYITYVRHCAAYTESIVCTLSAICWSLARMTRRSRGAASPRPLRPTTARAAPHCVRTCPPHPARWSALPELEAWCPLPARWLPGWQR
jgi:hypothetical protein